MLQQIKKSRWLQGAYDLERKSNCSFNMIKESRKQQKDWRHQRNMKKVKLYKNLVGMMVVMNNNKKNRQKKIKRVSYQMLYLKQQQMILLWNLIKEILLYLMFATMISYWFKKIQKICLLRLIRRI
ncbi:unnamed protein product [Paramecium sonneborni]|uniref:Transmembrane protein n=1 Tax=Paramecium sonneborni TaxID=65129 RepID=A0A8S1R901_9CILI|nr:unnamed protein product [Paramecium sonneborni]